MNTLYAFICAMNSGCGVMCIMNGSPALAGAFVFVAVFSGLLVIKSKN